MSEWISVKDRLPEKKGFVIVRSIGAVDDEYQTGTLIAYFSTISPKGQEFHSGQRVTHVTCTHWMPLPEPPTP